jgi:hypothetical protein
MIIEPKTGLTGILENPIVIGRLEAPNRYFFGWEFSVGDKDILVTKFRWFNASNNTKARRIDLFDFPNGDLITYSEVIAPSQGWGSQPVNNNIILKSGKTYRILLKVPNNQEYFYSDVSTIKFSNNGIKFNSSRYSDDMISVFETKALSEFPDIEYKILD